MKRDYTTYNSKAIRPCKNCRGPATSTLCYRCSWEQLTELKLFMPAKSVRV